MRFTRTLQGAAAAALLLAATACGSSGSGGGSAATGLNPPDLKAPTKLGKTEGQVNLIAWAGYVEDGSNDPKVDWVSDFEKQTGCQVNSKVAASSDEMVKLMTWAQDILYLQPGAVDAISGVHWIFKAHITLGLTIFLLFPFTRLVHILSAPVRYLWRPGYQIVRTRRGARVPVAGVGPRAANPIRRQEG